MSNRTRLGGVVVLIALVIVGAAAGTRWSYQLREVTTTSGDAPPPPPVPSLTYPPEVDLLRDGLDERAAGLTIGEFMTYFGLLAAAVLIVITIVYLRRRSNEPAPEITTPHDQVTAGLTLAIPSLAVQLPALRRGVAHARSLLDTAAAPRDAVTAAWIALEDAAADTGHRRHPAQTPTEFTTTVLDATPADPDAVATLLALYQRARFTTHPVTPQDVDAARDCLERLAIAFTPPDETADESEALARDEEPAPRGGTL
jgi:hypothetical protein